MRGGNNYCLVGREFQFYKMKRVLEIRDGGGNIMNMLGITELYIEKWFAWQILCYVYFTTTQKNRKEKKIINLFCKFSAIPDLCSFKHFSRKIHSQEMQPYSALNMPANLENSAVATGL